jgi:sec-independent protein translocase protein TatC
MSQPVNASLLMLLMELRKRLLHCIFILMIFFAALCGFANHLYTLLARPLLKFLPHDHGLIAVNIVAPIFAPMELTFFVALFLAIPFFLYQVWRFVAPALYQREKRLIWPLLLISTLLFYLGIAFAYFIILPLLFGFIVHTVPQGVNVSPDISEYLDFTLKLFFLLGLTFEIPVITILLIWTGVVTRKQLVKMRPYIIIGAFVLSMLLGPPDVFSQTLLALPMWFLFEAGVFLSRFWYDSSSSYLIQD